MALNQEYIELKKKIKKPFIYCPNKKHYLSRFPIPFEDIHRCSIESCFCKQQNGWIATCIGCGTILHNCIWGCKAGIPLTKINIEQQNKVAPLRQSHASSYPIILHGNAFHFYHPKNLEY